MLSPRVLGGLVFITLAWGANWPIMKFTLREMTPLWFRAITLTGGALVLIAWYAARGVSLRLPVSTWVAVAALAAPNVLGWHGLSIFGVQALASGRAAILGFTMPIWTVLLSILFFGERLTRRAALSAACTGIAVALLLAHELSSLAGRPLGILWMQLAALSWAVGTIRMRRAAPPLPTPVITVWMLLMSSAVLWALAPLFEPVPTLHLSAGTWVALAWGVVVNAGVAQIVWFALARELPPTASTFAIMAVPVVGTGSATFITGEVPRLTDVVAAGFVLVAIASALLPRGAVPSWRPAPRRGR